MVVYNTLVVEYEVENLIEYLKENTVESDSCLSFNLEMLEKMKESWIKTFKKEYCETPGLYDLREYLTTKYKSKLQEDWNRFYSLGDFELYIEYQELFDLKDFCLKKKEKWDEYNYSHFLNFFEKNWKYLVDYCEVDDWYYPIWSIYYISW